MQKFVLGTANFGSHYGITNREGKLSLETIAEIMSVAHASGIRTLDTANAYGDCHEILGKVGVNGWEIFSKVSAIPGACEDVSRLISDQFEATLKKLRVGRIKGLLLHNASDLLGLHGDEVFSELSKFRAQRLIDEIGISIYEPSQLESITKRFDIDLVQAPLNVLDTQIQESGWLDRLESKGVNVHARSVFLQGLLLSRESQASLFFSQWQDFFVYFNKWVDESKQSAFEKCLAHVKSFKKVACIVIGVDNVRQLSDLTRAITIKPERAPKFECENLQTLINPSLWVA